MFIGSMIIIALGALFHYLNYSASVYLSFFFYGLGIFFLSAIILFIGTLLAAKSGKLQKRDSRGTLAAPAMTSALEERLWGLKSGILTEKSRPITFGNLHEESRCKHDYWV